MGETQQTDAARQPTPDAYPLCVRCDKPVESLTVNAHPTDTEKVIVRYECHGEHVTHTLPANLLTRDKGLAGYTAFSAYTSGLMPNHEK
ncbi:MAG: hypothetical protein MSG64_13020 [Pyrinomonadaceae bacterium MAG19_C2-C3]|nr:hypothetical protein [Pyrinomonadaceae bacterium MAG19_C2-C3]